MRTGDDFHLTVFRIPGLRQDKPPVFMLHGVQSTSGIFVGLGKRSIGEFWLLNYRVPIKSILTSSSTKNNPKNFKWDVKCTLQANNNKLLKGGLTNLKLPSGRVLIKLK